MGITCEVCRGAVPSGVEPREHTALCAEWVRKEARKGALEEAAREVRYYLDQLDMSEDRRKEVIAAVIALADSPLPPMRKSA